MTCSEAADILRELAVRHGPLIKSLAAGSVVFFILTPVAVPFLIVLMPADALIRQRKSANRKTPLRTVLHLMWHAVKNLIGIALMALGVALLFLPGQGLLTLFAGILLADIPGRRTLLSRLLCTGKIRPAVDRLRARYGKKALLYPAESPGESEEERTNGEQKCPPGDG